MYHTTTSGATAFPQPGIHLMAGRVCGVAPRAHQAPHHLLLRVARFHAAYSRFTRAACAPLPAVSCNAQRLRFRLCAHLRKTRFNPPLLYGGMRTDFGLRTDMPAARASAPPLAGRQLPVPPALPNNMSGRKRRTPYLHSSSAPLFLRCGSPYARALALVCGLSSPSFCRARLSRFIANYAVDDTTMVGAVAADGNATGPTRHACVHPLQGGHLHTRGDGRGCGTLRNAQHATDRGRTRHVDGPHRLARIQHTSPHARPASTDLPSLSTYTLMRLRLV